MSERLAFLCIMGPNWGCFETPRILHHYGIEGFQGGPQLGPHFAERRQSLGQRMRVFQSGAKVFWQKKKEEKKSVLSEKRSECLVCGVSWCKREKKRHLQTSPPAGANETAIFLFFFAWFCGVFMPIRLFCFFTFILLFFFFKSICLPFWRYFDVFYANLSVFFFCLILLTFLWGWGGDMRVVN